MYRGESLRSSPTACCASTSLSGSGPRNTAAVVAGSSPGASKVKKAEKLEVPVLDEQEFEHLLATGELLPGATPERAV